MGLTFRRISEDDVDEIVQGLANVFQADRLEPCCVIAELEGGLKPGFILLARFGSSVPLISVRMPRTGKPLWAYRIFGPLARRVWPSLARWLEKQDWRLRRHAHVHRQQDKSIEPRPDLANALRSQPALKRASPTRPVVIVTDAIDTGESEAVIIKTLAALGVSRTSIKVMCVSHVFPDPYIRAEYHALENVVPDFPWTGKPPSQAPAHLANPAGGAVAAEGASPTPTNR